MKRCIAGLLALALVTGCSSLTINDTKSTSPMTQDPATVTATSANSQTQAPQIIPSSTSASTKGEDPLELILGKTYALKNLDIVIQNLYRSKDKSGREGLLIEYTRAWGNNTPGEELPQFELALFLAGKPVRTGGDPPGHELVSYEALELLPGGTVQQLVFFETVLDKDLVITLSTVPKDSPGYRLTASYPKEFADLAELEAKLKKDRLVLNQAYLKNVPDQEDLALLGQTIKFTIADVTIRETKTVPNDIFGGRDLIVTYSYKPTPESDQGKEDYLNIQIQAFQYGVEIQRQFIDEDARPMDSGTWEGDLIVNYRDVGALVIRVFDPLRREELTFVPGKSDSQ